MRTIRIVAAALLFAGLGFRAGDVPPAAAAAHTVCGNTTDVLGLRFQPP